MTSQGIADGCKGTASKLVQATSASAITRGDLRKGIAMEHGKHGLNAPVVH